MKFSAEVYYAVVDVRSRAVRYQGGNLARAADALEPGTCHGRGALVDLAVQDALDWAERFHHAAELRRLHALFSRPKPVEPPFSPEAPPTASQKGTP